MADCFSQFLLAAVRLPVTGDFNARHEKIQMKCWCTCVCVPAIYVLKMLIAHHRAIKSGDYGNCRLHRYEISFLSIAITRRFHYSFSRLRESQFVHCRYVHFAVPPSLIKIRRKSQECASNSNLKFNAIHALCE